MTNSSKKEKQALMRLTDLLVEDVLDLSDEEILAEFEEKDGTPNAYGEKMRAAFKQNIIKSNKENLKAAQAAVAQNRDPTTRKTLKMNIEEARAELQRLGTNKSAPQHFTLAARKESELSDEDLLDLIEDAQALGLLSDNDSKDDS